MNCSQDVDCFAERDWKENCCRGAMTDFACRMRRFQDRQRMSRPRFSTAPQEMSLDDRH